MADLWVVVLRTGNTGDSPVHYGPIEGEQTARDFAAFMTAEVDPATPHRLRSPEKELLSWWRVEREVQ